MSITLFLIFATFFLAYSNGANDNFKGVATLFGSDTTNYKGAIAWATIATFAGSISSIFLAETLLKRFSGKGLVSDLIAVSPEFLLAVAIGAGLTVMIATVTGFPISTTHSLIGALVGAGLTAVGTSVNLRLLGKAFFLPLLLSPFVAILLSYFLYIFFRFSRVRMGITKETCICIGEKIEPIADLNFTSTAALKKQLGISASVNLEDVCIEQYTGSFVGMNAQKFLDSAHYFSSGIVSFARGLNDTPKIVALLLAVEALQIKWGMLAIAISIAIGGLINARKVAVTISKKITPMNHGQGFTANVVTGFLVVFASHLGFPVSTTHVSVGSLFGIGAVTGKANVRVISEILLSWVLTLPLAAIISSLAYFLVVRH